MSCLLLIHVLKGINNDVVVRVVRRWYELKIVGYANVLNSRNDAIYKTNMRGQQWTLVKLVDSIIYSTLLRRAQTVFSNYLLLCS